jgi:glycoside/pentoside/hexuronide:cation symporter, GPH family
MTEFDDPVDNLPQLPQAEKLNLWTKIAYGAGDVGSAITANILIFYSLPFLTNVAGLPPGLAGSILTIGKISDAINDPIIGIMSDRTKTRWGRRLPWMFWGIIPFGIFFFLQWTVPHFSDDKSTNNWYLFAYYVVLGIVFNLAYTAVNLPYTALTPELTQDYHERTSLNSFRFTFSIGSSIVSLIVTLFIFNSNLEPQQQYLILGFASTLLAIVPLYWCSFSIQERGKRPFLERSQKRVLGFILLFLASLRLIVDSIQFFGNYPKIDGLNVTWLLINTIVLAFATTLLLIKPEPHLLANNDLETSTDTSETASFSEQLKIAFTNKPFLYVVGIYLCSWLAVQLTASILAYFVLEVVGLPIGEFTKTTLAVQGTALLMLFVWQYVSRKIGKQAVYILGMSLWIVAEIGLFLLNEGQVWLLYFLAVLAGFGVSVAYLIPWSMIPDVIELDELQTGKRREGIFYGFMVLLQKMGLALGLFIVGWILEKSGFQANASAAGVEQSSATILAIRLGISLIPAVFLVLGLFLNHSYPITEEFHQEIRLRLLEKKQTESKNDI